MMLTNRTNGPNQLKIRRLKYVSEYLDRHGNWRARFRKGSVDHTFVQTAGTPEFQAEYDTLINGLPPQIGFNKTKRGTISALIVHYYKTPKFVALKPDTKRDYKCVIEKFRGPYGERLVSALQGHHIEMILAKYVDTPSQANKLLKRLKQLMKLAVRMGMITRDPTVGVDFYKIKGDGFYSWTDVDILRFEKHHPIGSTARLAFALMLYLGQRRSDVVLMGPQHMKGKRISIKQVKTNTSLTLPLHPALKNIINKTKCGHLSFLNTAYGKPFTPAGIGNKMRDWCDAAGLSNCTSHGLRKASGRLLAEAGGSEKQIMAVLGHKSSKEVEVYTKAASQVLLADQAIALLGHKKTPKKNR